MYEAVVVQDAYKKFGKHKNSILKRLSKVNGKSKNAVLRKHTPMAKTGLL